MLYWLFTEPDAVAGPTAFSCVEAEWTSPGWARERTALSQLSPSLCLVCSALPVQ